MNEYIISYFDTSNFPNVLKHIKVKAADMFQAAMGININSIICIKLNVNPPVDM